MTSGDWLFRDPPAQKMSHIEHKMMLKRVPECLSPAFLKNAKLWHGDWLFRDPPVPANESY